MPSLQSTGMIESFKEKNMHPIFAQAIYPFAPPGSEARKLADYIHLLDTMDWQYEFSDDHSVYLKGRAHVDEARKLQAEVDPKGGIWMSYKQAKQHGAPQPIIKEQA